MVATTRPAGARVRWRDVDGILLLDKPAGLSSSQALQKARRLLRAAKGGHAGTLDPLATGMLPLCLGQATKACGQLLGARKAYRATIALGRATRSGDADGEVVGEAEVPDLAPERVARVLAALCGDRQQVPPMHSALKRDGRRLYELARRGEEVERAPRAIRIDRLELVRCGPRALEVEVVCSKGTYVRVLGEEIAVALGTLGFLSGLRRLWVEPFEGEPMVTLEALEAWSVQGGSESSDPPGLLAVDRAFPHLPELLLDRARALQLRQGRAVHAAPMTVAPGELLRAYEAGGGFLGLVAAGGDGLVRVKRLFVPGATGNDDASP